MGLSTLRTTLLDPQPLRSTFTGLGSQLLSSFCFLLSESHCQQHLAVCPASASSWRAQPRLEAVTSCPGSTQFWLCNIGQITRGEASHYLGGWCLPGSLLHTRPLIWSSRSLCFLDPTVNFGPCLCPLPLPLCSWLQSRHAQACSYLLGPLHVEPVHVAPCRICRVHTFPSSSTCYVLTPQGLSTQARC